MIDGVSHMPILCQYLLFLQSVPNQQSTCVQNLISTLCCYVFSRNLRSPYITDYFMVALMFTAVDAVDRFSSTSGMSECSSISSNLQMAIVTVEKFTFDANKIRFYSFSSFEKNSSIYVYYVLRLRKSYLRHHLYRKGSFGEYKI